MTDKKAKYIENVGWRYETEHSMTRRMVAHDYQKRCIYMLTLTLADRRHPLLGQLRWASYAPGVSNIGSMPGDIAQGIMPIGMAQGSMPSDMAQGSVPGGMAQGSVPGGLVRCCSAASFTPSPLGAKVMEEWRRLCRDYPQLQIIRLQLMPEHLHVVVFVRERLPLHLSKLIGMLKNRSNKHYWQMLNAQGLLGPKGTQTPPPLFDENFQDTILTHDGQLDTMVRYVEQNPFRALVKRENPDLFKVVAEVEAGGVRCQAIGNRWLLDRAVKMQVRCHNNITPQNLRLIAQQKEYFLCRGRKGGVVVSPCISAGEKEIARAVLDAGQPLVVILENGFPPLYKPPGKYFEACARGLLLMLAPWPYHMEKRKISRSQCLQLNSMAQDISDEPWTLEMEAQMLSTPGWA